MEPDHASSVQAFLDRWPRVTLVGNAKTFQLLDNYFILEGVERLTVKEGDTLSLGAHTLRFVTAPMVHWPEVMMTYEESEKLLFSADAFGQFGALDEMPDWDVDEARRYYLNIVGKYGPQVQAVLKKAAGLSIRTICPLHGPTLDETIPHVLEKYQLWSTYAPESEGVLIAYASLHGNTAAAAERLADILDQRGCPDVVLADLARVDPAEALAYAFRFGKVVLCASTYNAGLMPFMEDFLHHLKAKNWQKRTVGLVENGSWAPMAAKTMREALAGMKDITVLEPAVTIKGAPKTTGPSRPGGPGRRPDGLTPIPKPFPAEGLLSSKVSIQFGKKHCPNGGDAKGCRGFGAPGKLHVMEFSAENGRQPRTDRKAPCPRPQARNPPRR